MVSYVLESHTFSVGATVPYLWCVIAVVDVCVGSALEFGEVV